MIAFALLLVACIHPAALDAGCTPARTPPGCAPVAYCAAPDLRWFTLAGEEPDALCRPDDQRCIEAALSDVIAASCGRTP